MFNDLIKMQIKDYIDEQNLKLQLNLLKFQIKYHWLEINMKKIPTLVGDTNINQKLTSHLNLILTLAQIKFL